MTPPDKAPSRPPASPTDKRIKKRLLIAGGVVVLALGVAALLSNQRPKVETTAGSPQTSSGKIVNKDASGNVIEKLEASAPEAGAPVASAPAARAAAPQTSPGLPSSPDTGRTPALAAVGPAELLPPPAAPAVKPAPVKQQPAPPPPMAEVQKKLLPITNAPVAPSKPSVPTAATAAPAKPEGSSLGYQLQLGVFSSTENADKLVKALKEKGIEAHTETRVTVGPYRSRAEAEEAVATLKGLGYNPLLLPGGPSK
ncbi:SPOR domain-containing protein [Crenobacter sp. SG2305]|uniref:SPOR domain-containing protein n=1 Tax=Crenobacter oryzisoli TaxID=3056844 RepID=UPI0025AA735D|nr:SPOR domain-containing protein [Crenobacter sp. SG2305]MDN0081384.1 SPOR domain-containing protein [Crenobacter sp. SG2305]